MEKYAIIYERVFFPKKTEKIFIKYKPFLIFIRLNKQRVEEGEIGFKTVSEIRRTFIMPEELNNNAKPQELNEEELGEVSGGATFKNIEEVKEAFRYEYLGDNCRCGRPMDEVFNELIVRKRLSLYTYVGAHSVWEKVQCPFCGQWHQLYAPALDKYDWSRK